MNRTLCMGLLVLGYGINCATGKRYKEGYELTSNGGVAFRRVVFYSMENNLWADIHRRPTKPHPSS